MTPRKAAGWTAFAAFAAAGLILEFALPSGHGTGHWWDRVPAFHALLGFAGAALLAFGAKLLAKLVVGQDEDYYDR
ncbi:MAG: hypothetical protein FJY80_02580 [Candidatus Aminicenantes bacterium]|nr:hypothetical protein [Candidatus Aminicenantes bacterium]